MWALEEMGRCGHFYFAGFEKNDDCPWFSNLRSQTIKFYSKKEALSCAKANYLRFVLAVRV